MADLNKLDSVFETIEAPDIKLLREIGKRIGFGRACQILGEQWDDVLEKEWGLPRGRGKMERRNDIEAIEAAIAARTASQTCVAKPELPVKTWRERAEETEFDSLMAADCLALADKEIKELRAALRAYGQRAAQPGNHGAIETVVMDGHQLKEALGLINPDGDDDPDQLDDWLTFGVVQHADDDGKVSTGLCCWNDDMGGEVYPLDGEPVPDEKENCPKCKQPWAEHEFAVPAPYCPVVAGAAPSQPQQEAVPAEQSEQDKLDAERYRWLRDKARSVDWSRNWNVTTYTTHCRTTAVEMDKAIDTSIAAAARQGSQHG